MFGMNSALTPIRMGNQRYFDVYLDDPSTSEDEDHIDISRPLMSPRKYLHPRRSGRPLPSHTNILDTKLPKRKSVWYFKRKRDCLQAFYIIMIIMVIVIFGLVLMRILNDAAKHRSEEEGNETSKISTLTALGNFAVSSPFGVPLKPLKADTPPPPLNHQSSNNVLIPPKKLPPHSTLKGKNSSAGSGPQQHKEPAVDTAQGHQRTILPCTGYTVQDVWIKNIPQLMVESGIRLLDANQDGVLDAIIGFATDANAYFADEYLMCSIYFNGTSPCFGGVLALDGISGQELWRHYTSSEVFAVNCNGDVTGDGVNDCAVAGRAGVMEMVNGASGESVWKYKPSGPDPIISNFYTAQFLHDIDDDGVHDVLNIQGGDPVRKPGGQVRYSGKLMLFSGADGHVIRLSEAPDGMESYYSPQIYYQRGGKAMVLFGTGGETIGGSLWVVPLDDLIDGNMKEAAHAIYTDQFKGVMTPPVLIDLTGDGVMDIVMSMFNSTVIAFNGQDYRQLWKTTLPFSESYVTPSAGYYNDDDVPDFMVIYNYGPGFPLYYYAQVTILDGRNGQPLLHDPIISSGSVTTSPLTVSTEGYGNDAFFYWKLDCQGHEGQTTAFQFADQESGIGALSQTDFCRQRFNAATVSLASLLNQHINAPGQEIYNSADRFAEEHRFEVNATVLAMNFLKKYPLAAETVIAAQKNDHHEHEDNSDNPDKTVTQKQTTARPKLPVTTVAPDFPATTLDFEWEYNRLLSKLANISRSMSKDGKGPKDDILSAKSSATDEDRDGEDAAASASRKNTDASAIRKDTDEKIPDSPKVVTEEAVQGAKDTGDLDKLADHPGVEDFLQDSPGTANPSTSDSVFGEDFVSKLQGLGFPDSWLDPAEGDEVRGQGDDSDLSDDQLKGVLLNLLGLDDNSPDVKRKRSTRNTGNDRSNVMHERSRRHAGLHDAAGIQRVISTGTLAPPLSPVLDDTPSDPNSIDVIFATYWFYPKAHKIITAEEQRCIDDWMAKEQQRMDPSNEYYGMDHDIYEHLGSEHCSKKAQAAPTPSPDTINPLDLYPFNLDAGEMTVFRLRLACDCGLSRAKKTDPGARCAQILPHRHQQWGAYMGTYGNSYFPKKEPTEH